jgi:hypothetical protein
MRAIGASLVILSITLFGMGAGPQAVGILNDVLAPSLGKSAVRYSMVIVVSSTAIGALLLFLGSRGFLRDSERSLNQSRQSDFRSSPDQNPDKTH